MCVGARRARAARALACGFRLCLHYATLALNAWAAVELDEHVEGAWGVLCGVFLAVFCVVCGMWVFLASEQAGCRRCCDGVLALCNLHLVATAWDHYTRLTAQLLPSSFPHELHVVDHNSHVFVVSGVLCALVLCAPTVWVLSAALVWLVWGDGRSLGAAHALAPRLLCALLVNAAAVAVALTSYDLHLIRQTHSTQRAPSASSAYPIAVCAYRVVEVVARGVAVGVFTVALPWGWVWILAVDVATHTLLTLAPGLVGPRDRRKAGGSVWGWCWDGTRALLVAVGFALLQVMVHFPNAPLGKAGRGMWEPRGAVAGTLNYCMPTIELVVLTVVLLLAGATTTAEAFKEPCLVAWLLLASQMACLLWVRCEAATYWRSELGDWELDTSWPDDDALGERHSLTLVGRILDGLRRLRRGTWRGREPHQRAAPSFNERQQLREEEQLRLAQELSMRHMERQREEEEALLAVALSRSLEEHAPEEGT